MFVGNLSYETNQSELESLFSAVGEIVEVFFPLDRNTGRPRGFAFVELADEAAARDAIDKFHGQEFKGRNLRVTEAEERRPHQRGGFHGGPPPGDRGGGGRRSKPKGSRRNIRGKKRSL